MTQAAQILILASALAAAAMGGVYFAFSAFVMTALANLDRGAGAAAMNAINRVILRSAFMPLFWGSTLAGLALAGLAVRTGDPALLAGGVIYVAGMFGVTAAFNVPLNNRLAAAAAGDDAVWRAYLRDWTRWNHLRTAACLASAALFLAARH